MKHAIFLAALFSMAASTVTARLPPGEVMEKRAREWRTTVCERYDLSALAAFLHTTITEKKSVRGIDITKPKFDATGSFAVNRCELNFGDWAFLGEPQSEVFEFWVFIQTPKFGQFLRLKCGRDGPKRFHLVDTALTECEPSVAF